MSRPKGSPNRIGAGVKSNVIGVFDKIGGRDKMCEWALANLTEFYKLYARLIPSETTTTIDFREPTELTRSELLLIATGSSQRASQKGNGEGELSEFH